MLRIASCQTNRLFILLERAEKEICFSIANGMFKLKMDIDRHGPRLMTNNYKNLNPPYFSLPSTFKRLSEEGAQKICIEDLEIKIRMSFRGLVSTRSLERGQDKSNFDPLLFVTYCNSTVVLGIRKSGM